MKFVAYYRVSTKKQENSGLGLESQKQIVKQYIGNDNSKEVIAEYQEIESGKNDKRIELENAIRFAKDNNAILLIAKLDRLSRNASFIFKLRDANIEFVCCDMPQANTLTIGIFALLAQQERELISQRTKSALQIKKQQGFKLGNPKNLNDNSRKLSIESRKELANENENNKKAIALIQSMRQNNESFRAIANKLNDFGFKTSKGNQFFAMSVKQLFDRYTSQQ